MAYAPLFAPLVSGRDILLNGGDFESPKNFNSPLGRRILGKAVNQGKSEFPFYLDTWVLLPDHLHAIWTLPEGDTNYGKRVGLIKAHFSKDARNQEMVS